MQIQANQDYKLSSTLACCRHLLLLARVHAGVLFVHTEMGIIRSMTTNRCTKEVYVCTLTVMNTHEIFISINIFEKLIWACLITTISQPAL
jgi:hypothetical protein